jgi:hypothetical protein
MLYRPTPRLRPTGPLALAAARAVPHPLSGHQVLDSSLVRLASNRLVLAFAGRVTHRSHPHEQAVMLTASDDDGVTWRPPWPIFAVPGWSCGPLGVLLRYTDDRLHLDVGCRRLETITGSKPGADWSETTIAGRDDGAPWLELGAAGQFRRSWPSLSLAGQPHQVADGRFLLGWWGLWQGGEQARAGVTTSDSRGEDFTPPVIIAADPQRNFRDIALLRLADARFLALIQGYQQCFAATSTDEGQNWSLPRPTGFKGGHPVLLQFRSGAILCIYRDDDLGRGGVSCSVSDDGGERWRLVGQLYHVDHRASKKAFPRGRPYLVYHRAGEIICLLHTDADRVGQIGLHILRLRERASR